MAKFPIDHIGIANGVDRSRQPHEVKDGKWWDSLNFRHRSGKIKQIPRLISYVKCGTANNNRVTAIRTIPVKHQNRAHVLAFCGGKVYRLKRDITMAQLSGANSFRSGGIYGRWATVVHESKVYFTNLLSPIAYTDGATVKKFSTNVPSARYASMFFDHLVVADVNFNGSVMANRIMWSDLFKVGNWEAKRSNEADYYDLIESAADNDEVGGITGLARMNNAMVIYTPTIIYEGVYVGLPRVMRIDQKWAGVGCDLRYGVASLESMHFFPNKRLRNFFKYAGGQPTAIGDEIADFFFNDIHPDGQTQQMTWSFIDETNNEVWWVYVNSATTFAAGYNAAVVYNIKEGTWYRASVTDASAFGGTGVVAKSVDELTGTINQLAETTNDLGLNQAGAALVVPRLWGGRNGMLYKEGAGGEVIDKFTPYLQPVLETGDFIYHTLQREKEVESLFVDGVASASGLQVILDKKELLNGPEVGVNAGNWLSTLPEGKLSFPRSYGKVLSYRFRPVMPNFSTVYQRVVAHVEIETAKYRLKTFEATSGAGFFMPETTTGMMTFVLVGAGGGGGAKPFAPMTQNAFVPSATKKWFNAAKPVKYLREYDPTIGTSFHIAFLSETDGVFGSNTTKRVYIPYNALYPDPNLDPGMTASISALMYSAAVTFTRNFARSLEPASPFWGYVSVYFEQYNPGGATGYLFTEWAAGLRILRAIPNPSWRVSVEYVQTDTTAHYLQTRGAGGAGGYIRGRFPIDANGTLTPQVAYSVGAPLDHIPQGTGTMGQTGGFSYLESTFGTFSFKANGGTGGGDNGAGAVVNGVGGTIVKNLGGVCFSDLEVVGDAAVAEAFPTLGTAGKGVNLYGVKQTFAKRDLKGFKFGGGGCGRKEDYLLNAKGTIGAGGYLWIGWRIGPDGVAYPYPGFAGSNIEKTALKQTSTQIVSMGGVPFNTTLTFAVRGVVETKNYTGGAVVVPYPYVYSGGAPAADNRSILKLQFSLADLSNPIYYLNRLSALPGDYPASPNFCDNLDYTFQITLNTPQSMQLTLDNVDSKQWEPRDVNGVAIDTSEGSDLHEPQWATVELIDYVIAPVNSETLTELSAFSELVYGPDPQRNDPIER